MEHVRQAYANMADQYIELFGNTTYMHSEDLALITRRLAIRPGTVLDVGCGPGSLTEHLRMCDVDVVGIDVVPEFIEHACTAYPRGRFEIASMDQLPLANGSIGGMLAWYSLIHLPTAEIDDVLLELRRVMSSGAVLVVGFFAGDEVTDFAHGVTTAYYWPVDELAARLHRAGFTEAERQHRPGVNEPGRRPEAAIVAIAS
jgi:ubiquinone/menaquinone biosynthesis C-methylase UbiE